MLRKAPLYAWFLSATACVVALLMVAMAQAEGPARAGTSSRRSTAEAPAPAAFPGGSASAMSLADRLKAIRNSGTTELQRAARPPAGKYPAETRVAIRPGAAEVVSPEPPSRIDDQRGLKSVLLRRGKQPDNAADARSPAESAGPATPVIETSDDLTSPAPIAMGPEPTAAERVARRPSVAEGRRSTVPFHRMPGAGSGHLSLVGQGPTMRATLIGPATVTVGQEVTYRVRLENLGTTIADRVLVYVAIPPHVQILHTEAANGSVAEKQEGEGRRLVWELDQVQGDSRQELALQLKATENRNLDLQVDWMFRPLPVTAQVKVQQPKLELDIDGPSEMNLGDTEQFTVTIRNTGNGPAADVELQVGATGIAAQANALGTLEAGTQKQVTIELLAQQAGPMKIAAQATGAVGVTAAVQREITVRQPHLELAVVAPSLVFSGSVASYQLRVANTGDAAAEEVVLELQLPQGAQKSVGIDSKPTSSLQPKWRLGTLSAGASQVYTVQCQLSQAGINRLVAHLRGKGSLSASAAGRTQVEAIADLKLIANDPQGPVPIGTDVTYEIQIVNRGTKEARDIHLVAQFSDGIEPSSARGHHAEIVPGQVIFDTIDAIPAGGKVALKVIARAATTGNLRFRAELTCGDPETKLVTEESTRFYDSSQYGKAAAASQTPTPARR